MAMAYPGGAPATTQKGISMENLLFKSVELCYAKMLKHVSYPIPHKKVNNQIRGPLLPRPHYAVFAHGNTAPVHRVYACLHLVWCAATGCCSYFARSVVYLPQMYISKKEIMSKKEWVARERLIQMPFSLCVFEERCRIKKWTKRIKSHASTKGNTNAGERNNVSLFVHLYRPMAVALYITNYYACIAKKTYTLWRLNDFNSYEKSAFQ